MNDFSASFMCSSFFSFSLFHFLIQATSHHCAKTVPVRLCACAFTLFSEISLIMDEISVFSKFSPFGVFFDVQWDCIIDAIFLPPHNVMWQSCAISLSWMSHMDVCAPGSQPWHQYHHEIRAIISSIVQHFFSLVADCCRPSSDLYCQNHILNVIFFTTIYFFELKQNSS